MNFERKLKKQQYDQLWQEYCGFLDLTIPEYMQIQKRLMLEQIQIWSESGLGKKLLKGKTPQTIDEFRKSLPLTSYSDYADVLLYKRNEMLPAEPVIWIQTTWEGGKHPVKLAPYTKGMLDVCKSNVMSAMMLATSSKRGDFDLEPLDKILFGLAPLPYVTGLFPLLLAEEMPFSFLPPVDEALKMSFGERNKKGFALGFQNGVDFFFGLSSVISYMTESFSAKGEKGSIKKLFSYSPKMMMRCLKAAYRSKVDGTPIKPKDIFKLKGFICAGTDTFCYKKTLQDAWGCSPMEIAAGTEPTLIGTETWARNGLILYPDTCFYEFIPELEMYKNLEDDSYQPKTYLYDELIPNQNYELVITVLKGGAFARYRLGDMYRCVGIGGERDGVSLPRLQFVDRVPTVIDIAGFTRITEESIKHVISMSGLRINDWVALKEYSKDHRPYMHLFVEMQTQGIEGIAVSKQVLAEHLSAYFTYFDNDYNDLKKMLGIEPLQITILRSGTIEAYISATGKNLRRINPSAYQISELIQFQQEDFGRESGVYR